MHSPYNDITLKYFKFSTRKGGMLLVEWHLQGEKLKEQIENRKDCGKVKGGTGFKEEENGD